MKKKHDLWPHVPYSLIERSIPDEKDNYIKVVASYVCCNVGKKSYLSNTEFVN